MSRRFSRALGLLALSTALVLAPSLPAAAYAPVGAVTVSATTLDPGGSVRLSVRNGTFTPGETLTVTVRGENASDVSFALVRAGVQTATHTTPANTAGGLDPLGLTFPANASGTYTIAAFSASSSGGTATVTVGALSATGLDSQSLTGLWVGGSALVAAGVIVLVSVLVVRHRRRLDAA